MNALTARTVTTISAAPGGGGGGSDFFEFIDNLTSSATSTIGGILVLAGIIVALVIAFAKKTVGGVLQGLIIGGLIAGIGVFVVALSGLFEQTFTNENASGSPAIVQEAPETEALL